MPHEAKDGAVPGYRTVLIVDDDPALADLVARVAEQSGFRVRVTTSAEEALALAAAEPFDLVISDVQMPSLRGPDLLTRLNEMGVACPVLFISGDSSLSTVDDSLRTPRAMFLPKPFTRADLSEAIWTALKL